MKLTDEQIAEINAVPLATGEKYATKLNINLTNIEKTADNLFQS